MSGKKSKDVSSSKHERRAKSLCVAVFSSFLGFGFVSKHLASICVLEYWFEAMVTAPNYACLAQWFLKSDKFLSQNLKQQVYDIYFQCEVGNLHNSQVAFEWFCEQTPEWQHKIFLTYNLEDLVQYLHISRKNRASFLKALSPLAPVERSVAFITWYHNQKVLGFSRAGDHLSLSKKVLTF